MSRSCRNILVASLLACFLCGCASFWHDLQPHRLRRWNYGSAPALSPDFTQFGQPSKSQLVRLEGAETKPVVSANSAEVIFARGQNPEN